MLADTIKKYRKENNLSQDELAEKLGVSRQSISLWETGQTQPTIDNIVALSKIFNISADALLDNGADPAPAPVSQAPAPAKKPVWPIFLAVGLAVAAIVAVVLVILLTRPSGGDVPTGAVPVSSGSQTLSAQPADSAASASQTPAPASQTPAPVSQAPVSQTPAPVSQTPAVDLFACCKEFAIQKGHLNGDYTVYRQPASLYGGSKNDYIEISYWAGYNKVMISLYRPLNATESYAVDLIMRGGFNGTYEFVSSQYYRSSGENFLKASGTIDPATFSENYPLSSNQYQGDLNKQTEFLEYSRVGMCDLIRCLKQFVTVENMDCDFSDFGFKKF